MANVNGELTIGQNILPGLIIIFMPTPAMCKFIVLFMKNYGKVVNKLSTLSKATQVA